MIYDNSDRAGPQLIGLIAMGRLEVSDLDAAYPFHRRIASIIAESLGMSIKEVMQRRGPIL